MLSEVYYGFSYLLLLFMTGNWFFLTGLGSQHTTQMC